MRVEVARVRCPIDMGTLCEIVVALETEWQWTDQRVEPSAIIDGVTWMVITAEVPE